MAPETPLRTVCVLGAINRPGVAPVMGLRLRPALVSRRPASEATARTARGLSRARFAIPRGCSGQYRDWVSEAGDEGAPFPRAGGGRLCRARCRAGPDVRRNDRPVRCADRVELPDESRGVGRRAPERRWHATCPLSRLDCAGAAPDVAAGCPGTHADRGNVDDY